MKVVNSRGAEYGVRDSYKDGLNVPGYYILHDWFSFSCGARFVDDLSQSQVGIVVSPGHQGKEYKNQYGQVKHITSNAGKFTVRTKYVI